MIKLYVGRVLKGKHVRTDRTLGGPRDPVGRFPSKVIIPRGALGTIVEVDRGHYGYKSPRVMVRFHTHGTTLWVYTDEVTVVEK